ncbi:MAG TPA: polymer-forming cytoskeletal protein [Candidatus Krumholzibacteria bacterium]|nr:polymer-forming cytoskeletal protein [Candidatus Krumholzibacteria bacterium]
MFGKDTDATTSGGGDNRQTSILAQGCRFEGKVTVSGTFRVEGEFKGDIATPEQLIIGKTGVVNGTVKVKNAMIGGQLHGNIEAENKIELQSGSHVEGDIKTKRLVIDEGVFFEGNCSMGGPRKTPPPAGDGPAK